MADYRISGVHDAPGLDDNGRPTQTKVVSYYIGDHGPLQVSVPSSGDWDAKAEAIIVDNVQKFRRLGLI